jgi:8-oxo-dGTP pyrophosphatase MutT (NUDIX family)
MLDMKRKLAELNRSELNRTFKENQVPFILIAPDQDFHLLPHDLLTEYNDSEYLPPRFLVDEARTRIDHLIELSRKKDFTFFDDVLGRLDGATIMHSNKLLLKFSKASYFYFAALNKGLDLPLWSTSNTTTTTTTLRHLLNEDPYDLHSSVLPNPLGVVSSLILEPENKVVLTIHSSRNFEGSRMISAPVGGSLSIKEGDIDLSGLPDPFRTVAREANEELGLSISATDIKFFGLGRDLTTLKPELVGQIFLNLKEDELLEIQKNRAKDEWEIERQIIADSEEIPKFLSMNNWSPAGWVSTYLSFISINKDQ